MSRHARLDEVFAPHGTNLVYSRAAAIHSIAVLL
jgi:hypothetical protein